MSFAGEIAVSSENSFSTAQISPICQSARTVENSHSFFNVSYTWYKSLPCPNSFSTTKLKIDSFNNFLGHWGSQKEAVKSKISKFCYKNSCPLAKYLDSNIKIFANVKNIFGLFTTQCFTNSSLLTYSLMENNGGWVCKAIIFLSAKMTKAKLRFFAIQWLPCADMKCFMQCFTNVQ